MHDAPSGIFLLVNKFEFEVADVNNVAFFASCLAQLVDDAALNQHPLEIHQRFAFV